MTDMINFGDLFKQAKKEMTLIPDGDYNIVVTKADATKASTGSPMIKYTLKIEGGPQDGRIVYGQFTVSVDNPVALTIFFRQMMAFGFDETFWDGNPNLPLVAQMLVNRRALATIGHREWQGVDRNNVDAIKPIPGGGGNPTAVVPAGPASSGAAPATTASPAAGPKPPSF